MSSSSESEDCQTIEDLERENEELDRELREVDEKLTFLLNREFPKMSVEEKEEIKKIIEKILS